jgi:hypothetical protein
MKRCHIKIVPAVTQKYVLGCNKEGDMYICGDPTASWHKDIVNGLKFAGHELSEVHGGGKIYLFIPTKTIYVWDKSTNYGESPFQTVKELLETEFPGFKILNQASPMF